MNRQVLIIQTAFTGDVILALPIAQRIRTNWPEAKIHFLVRKGNENLLEHHPAIDQIWIWDKNQHKIRNLLGLMSQLSQIPFDLAVNCQRFLSTGILMARLNAKQKRGFSENPLSFLYSAHFPHTRSTKGSDTLIHEVDRNLNLLRDIFPTTREAPKIFPTQEEVFRVQQLLPPGKWIVLAPASVWFTKQWPIEKWKALVGLFPEDWIPVVVGGPKDADLGDLLLTVSNKGVNLCGKLSLRESAALMSLAHRVVCNDSAPLHLASAVSAPVTGIFCSTVPEFGFFPLSPNAVVIQETSGLECRPCGLHGKKSCPQGHFRCALEIQPESVFQTLL